MGKIADGLGFYQLVGITGWLSTDRSVLARGKPTAEWCLPIAVCYFGLWRFAIGRTAWRAGLTFILNLSVKDRLGRLPCGDGRAPT